MSSTHTHTIIAAFALSALGLVAPHVVAAGLTSPYAPLGALQQHASIEYHIDLPSTTAGVQPPDISTPLTVITVLIIGALVVGTLVLLVQHCRGRGARLYAQVQQPPSNEHSLSGEASPQATDGASTIDIRLDEDDLDDDESSVSHDVGQIELQEVFASTEVDANELGHPAHMRAFKQQQQRLRQMQAERAGSG